MQYHMKDYLHHLHWDHIADESSLIKPQWFPKRFKHEACVVTSLARYCEGVKKMSDEIPAFMSRVGLIDTIQNIAFSL